jgi:signal transduction histidine kinase
MPHRLNRAPRPTTALVLGILSGTLAALTVLPTIVPLTWQVASAEDEGEAIAARIAVAALEADPRPERAEQLLAPTSARAFWYRGNDGEAWTVPSLGAEDAWDPLGPCADQPEAVGRHPRQGHPVVYACRQTPTGLLGVELRAAPIATANVSWMVLGMAAMVGISTALGVLQLLSPLSEITQAVRRVGAGERGVRSPTTGLAELDDLSERVNAAARAMEDREDTILARIEVVQQLARMVAHEIRNPLQSLELLSSLVAAEPDPEERAHLASTIQGEVRTLESVVQRLLRDAPHQAALRPSRTLTSAAELVRSVHAFKRFAAERAGVQLELGTVDDVELSIDRALVRRALENLVSNALEAVRSPGGRVRMSAQRDDGGLLLVVEDNGPGVDPTLGNQIFQANVTTRAEGHGIGLALVHGVLQAHQGAVWHDRSELGGARFSCRLPTSLEEPKEKTRADPGGG